MDEWSSVHRVLQARRQGVTPTNVPQKSNMPVVQQQEQTVKPESAASTGERVLATVGDFFGNIITGAAKGIEGIIDLGAGIVGGIGGLFDQDFQNDVQDWVSNDWVGENIGNPIQEGTKASYLNDSKAGEIIEGIASGVGQMLPSIALTVATGGAAAPGMAVMAASAAGNATEEAYNQGAGYGQGLAYGALSGVVEAATEKIGGFVLGGGTSLVGKKLAGTALGKATSKGVGKVAETFVSEGAEEVLSDLANPALKYVTGVDKNIGQNYVDAFKGLPETFVVGGGAGAILGGGQNFIQSARNKNRGGANATRADAQLAYAQELTENYGDDIVQNKRYDNAVHQIYEQASEEIKKMKPEQRQKYLRSIGSQALAFNEDGSLRAKQAIDYNTEAMTASLRPVSGNLTFAPVQSNVAVNENAKKIKGVIEGVKQGAKVVVTDKMPNVEGYDSRAAYIPSDDVFYINNDVKADDPSVVNAIALHELTHKGEGTKAYNTLVGEVSRLVNDPNAPAAIKAKLGDYEARLAETKQAYADQGRTDAQNEYVVQTEMIADYMGDLLSDEYFVRKLGERNKSVPKRILSALRGLASGENKNVDPSVKKGLRKLYKAYVNTLDRAGYGVLVSEIDKDEVEEGVKINRNKSFAAQVDDVIEGRHNPNLDLYVGETPKVLLEIGLDNVPLVMRNSKIGAILNKHGEMSVELIKKIPEAIKSPLFILKSKTHPNDTVVVITEIEMDGQELIVPIRINETGTYLDVDLRIPVTGTANLVASAYGKDTVNLIKYAIENNGVLYVSNDKEKIREFSDLRRLQLPTRLEISNFRSDVNASTSTDSISQNLGNVNPSGENNSRNLEDGNKRDSRRSNSEAYTTQGIAETDSKGRKLTAQQREFFKDTKAVDEKGRLLEVYHGSKTGDFTIFQYDSSRQTGDDFGKAYYFTTNLKNARAYAKDNHKDPRVKQYIEERDKLYRQFADAARRGESQEKLKALSNEFINFRVDGKTLTELLYDIDYDTGGTILKVYLNLRNPLIVDAKGALYRKVYPRYFEQAKSNGNDGIIVKNVEDNARGSEGLSDVYIAFSENQIKLTSNENPTADVDIRRSLARKDSEGKVLSQGQRDFFKDSKVRDKEGNLLVAYHGSPNVFDEFYLSRAGENTGSMWGDGIYLTTNENVAVAYTEGKHGPIKAYVNLVNPLVLGERGVVSELRARGVDIDKYMREQGQSHEFGLDLTPILKAEGYDGIFDEPSGTIVAYESNQIKLTTNHTPTKSGNIRFSLKANGENISGEAEIKGDLVALHNLDERKLMKVLELGGFPMPSIAITRTSLGHDQYGKITVVFGRDTIDPQRDSRNVVYDRDAWTPTAPIVDVKLRNQGVDELIAELQEKAGEQPAYKNSIERFFDGKYRDNNGDYIVREYDYTKEAFGDRALQNSGIMAAYLNEKGIEVEPVYVERGFTLGWESYTRDEAARLFDQVGITKDVTRDNATKAKRQDILEKYIDYSARRRLARLRRFAKNTNLTIEEAKETLRSEYDDGNVSQLFFMAEDFFNENRPKDVYNEQATIDKMQDKIADKQDFYEWFWQKIESVYEKKGIDNDSDIFDSRGNRRSFEKRHFAYTAANIVKAMSKGDQEGKAALGMTAGALAAKLSKRFESIEDIRDAKEYLALVSEEDLQAFNDRTYEIYDELVTAIAGRSSDFMSDSARRDDVGAIIAKCATAKPLTVENIKRIFEQETKGYNLGYKFNDKLAEQALLLFESLKHVPTTYFEAKPRRAVGLDEIKAVLLPNTASERVKTALTDKGIPYTQYDAADVNARRDLIEKMENVRFSKARSFQSTDEDIRYSIRTKEPPKKTITAYKVFYAKDGGLYPPMVANPGGEPTPVGVWLDADVGEMAGTSATGRLQVKSGGKGTQGRGGKLAFRPGWHLGEYPKATQFNRLDPKTGKRDLFPKDFVWARCEIAADVDYQSEAESYGYTENGKYRHSYAGLPKVPEDGYYVYRTNPDPTTVPWYITGAMRVVEILDDNDVRRILQEHGQEPVQRQGGDIDLAQYGLRRGTVDNLRLSRKRNRDDHKFYYEMSRGEIKKLLANNTRMRVYAKKDIEQIINTVLDSYMSFGDKYGTLSNKNKAQVVDSLWQALNTAEKGKVGAVAIDAAEFIINSAVAEEMYEDYDRYEDVAIVNILRPYLNRINLDGIKGELLYIYDKEGFRAIRGRWGKRSDVTKFGIAPDELKLLLEDEGFRMEAEHPADVLAEVDSQYTNALARLKAKSKELFKDMLSAEERKKLRQDITREILIAADEKGAPSKLSKILEKYKKQLDAVKRRYDEVRHKNGAVNLLLDRVQKIKDIKSGAFLNATQYKSDLFKGSIEKLGRIKYRGNLNRVGTRKIFAALSEWYNAGNPMFKGMDGDQNGLRSNGVFNQEIKDMLDAIAQNEKPLTAAQEKTIAELEKKSGITDYAKLAEWYTRANVGTTYSSEVKRMLNELARPTEYSLQEVYAMQKIVQYFTHIIETYNMVLKNGKYVDAKELATRYIEKAEKAKKVKTGVVDRIVQSRYGQAFMDPLSIMRNADRYDEHGFFTETFFELQEGIIRSQKLENDLKKDFEEFFKSHKKYAQDLSERKVKYNGVEMSLDEALSLYMTLKREQAQAGLVYSGLSFEERSGKRLGKQSKPVHVKGLVGKDVTGLTPEEIEQTAKAARDDLAKQFNDTDMQFVAMLEKALNEDCKEIKRKTDTQRMGYSNVQEGYYYPIRRGYVASNVDSFNAQFEIDRVSNASFNKDTVKGAKGELYIEPVTRVFERHVRGIAQYAGLSTFIDNYNMLYNIDIGDNPNNVNNIRKTAEEVWKNNSQYIIKMLSDAQGIRKLDVGDKIIQRIRGAYVKFALGANPKVWLTQTTSLLAATSVLDVKNVVKGLSVKGADVDTYCDLAEIRNHDNTIALAQGVIDSIGKVGDFLMKPVGMVDRWVVKKLFGACQYQIQQNGGAKVGTVENKKAAGELLTRVILQTQQNSMVTERSSAMRSDSEVARTLTMFTSDAMKVIGRVVDAIGEYTVLKKDKAGADKMKAARRKTVKAVGALVSTSVFMALIAQAFRTLYNKDDEDENIAANMAIDMVGNMLGGLPVIKDVYARLMEGYEVSNYAYSTINNLLDSANNIFQAASDWISGDVDSKQTARNIKNMIYAAGQLLGIPVRNIYNVFDGLLSRFSASSAYKLDDLFYNQSYSSDLRKAIEEDDDEMASTIIGLMLNENIGDVTNENVRTELDRLVKSGHDVIPRSAPNSITYEGEEITLTAAQKRDFKQVYSEANNELASLVRLSAYRSASDDVKAKAVDIVYEMYYDLAVEDLIGEDLETKTVLFSKAFDIGKLALIVAQARLLTADKDDSGRSINGTKKAKIQSYINSLNLSAAEKYMIMGYLGYTNTHGEAQVQRYLRGIRGLTSTERQLLLEYSGYAA